MSARRSSDQRFYQPRQLRQSAAPARYVPPNSVQYDYPLPNSLSQHRDQAQRQSSHPPLLSRFNSNQPRERPAVAVDNLYDCAAGPSSPPEEQEEEPWVFRSQLTDGRHGREGAAPQARYQTVATHEEEDYRPADGLASAAQQRHAGDHSRVALPSSPPYYDQLPRHRPPPPPIIPPLRQKTATYHQTHVDDCYHDDDIDSAEEYDERYQPDAALLRGVAAGYIGGGFGPYQPYALQFPPPKIPESSDDHHGSDEPYRIYTEDAVQVTKPVYADLTAVLLYSTKEGPEADDFLHNPKAPDRNRLRIFSFRGWLNVIVLVAVICGLVTFFAVYPIYHYILHSRPDPLGAWNYGGTNASGQVPDIPGFATMIDGHTPEDVKRRTGLDGTPYVMVFSDEFEEEGRSFWPGDDPYFEAVDLHYWGTGDFEWYDRDAITTRDGKLQITVTQESIHNLSYRSGMLQSWNKLCFTGGYIEVSVSLPGRADVPGFWPGAWTMGNLARAGYGATTDGVWPFSYNTCDVGTQPNQTDASGNPTSARTGGGGPNGELSYQPGQRLSACTCKSAGKEHPGPSHNVGRGGPEIDILEAQVARQGAGWVGEVSQSAQIAPYDLGYTVNGAGTQMHANGTVPNSYKGGVYQQAVSGVSPVTGGAYGGRAYQTFGFEYEPGQTDGYITWTQGGSPMWTLNSSAMGPNAAVGIGQRLISEEPMYVILNLGMSASFQEMDWARLQFPATYYIDYVRIYQREGQENYGCDGKNRPTSKYIQDHINSYTNPLLTTHEQAGYTFPRNSRQDGC